MSYLGSMLKRSLQALDVILLAILLTAFITVSAFVVWPGWLRQAKEAGRLDERLKWEEAQKRVEADNADKLKKAQAKIDMAETSLLSAQLAGPQNLDTLDAAIAAEKAKDAASAQKGKDNRSCIVAPMPPGVRNSLNAIGHH